MKRIIGFVLVIVLIVFCFTGCKVRNESDNSNELHLSSDSMVEVIGTPSPSAMHVIENEESKYTDNIFLIDNNGDKKNISKSDAEQIEKTASILTQQILTFTDVANTEKSVYPQDFDTEDILNFCLAGGAFSGSNPYFYDFEHEEFYPYKKMGQKADNKFIISADDCRIIAKQLFGNNDLHIANKNVEFDKSFGSYSKLMLNKGTYEISGAVWKDGVVTATVTIRLNKGDKIKYKADFLPKESDGETYLQLKEIHKGDILVSFEADDYIKNLYPQLEYTIVSRYGGNHEDMAFYGTCLYYKNRGESGELFSFEELVAGNEDYSTNDNYYRTARNMYYLVENGNVVLKKDTLTEDSTAYEKISRGDVLLVSTYENTAPVKVRYTNYMLSDRKPKQQWINYFTQKKNNTAGAKDTPVVIYKSYEFVIDGVECALVQCTNFVEESVYDGSVLDGPPPGDEFIYYNDFHIFVGNKQEKTDQSFLLVGKVDTRPLSECATSFCGDEIEHSGKMLTPPQPLYCSFYDSQGNVAVYNIYDMMWTGDCSINMCREHDEELMVVDINGDGVMEILIWHYDHSTYSFHAFPAVYNLDTATKALVGKALNIEW